MAVVDGQQSSNSLPLEVIQMSQLEKVLAEVELPANSGLVIDPEMGTISLYRGSRKIGTFWKPSPKRIEREVLEDAASESFVLQPS